MKIYLCGPITLGGRASELEIRFYKARFSRESDRLIQSGHEILNPIDIENTDDTWEEAMKETVTLLCNSELVLVLPGHERSKGSALEILIAHLLGIPVKKVEEF